MYKSCSHLLLKYLGIFIFIKVEGTDGPMVHTSLSLTTWHVLLYIFYLFRETKQLQWFLKSTDVIIDQANTTSATPTVLVAATVSTDVKTHHTTTPRSAGK